MAFRRQGAVSAMEGQSILGRVRYEPGRITRVYVGSGFVVREQLIVPLDQPAAILSYSVESAQPMEIVVRAVPVLDLMWPASVGGQSTSWSDELRAYVLSEPLYGYSAVVGSAETAGHDLPTNAAGPAAGSQELSLILRPNAAGEARLFFVLNPAHSADPGALLRETMRGFERIAGDNARHAAEVLENAVAVETPDEEVNRAFASSEMALDQAWECNTDLGCGYVAGYGPSRAARRPQYDWFFAGDGLVDVEGALSDGDWTHAREELEFILRYQDKKSGMIWHELSQSAGFLDWVNKFPYMYVHVDVTFQFLGVVGRYVRTTGDVDFARQHWEALAAAYAYCRTQLDPATALPRIPADKEGGNEQDKLSDDLGLSASWIDAAEAVADLASLTGHADLAAQAAQAANAARHSIAPRYWDARGSFWISGHTVTGQPAVSRRSGPAGALTLDLFSPSQREAILDELASSRFQTDWGTRSIATDSADYDPASYAQGSVWPFATAALAQAFWAEHRPLTAFALWHALVPLVFLDSPGHMHEVLAGDSYHPQTESVPEQTWSSAAFVSATIQGLLGLKADGVNRALVFAPHLPAGWQDLAVRHLRVAGASVSLDLHRTGRSLSLKIQNQGEAFPLEFRPDLPLGAENLRARFNGAEIAGTILEEPQESLAQVRVQAPHGDSTLDLEFAGGILVSTEPPRPQLGDASGGVRVLRAALDRNRLTIDVDLPARHNSHLLLETPWKLKCEAGCTLKEVAAGRAELYLAADAGDSRSWRRLQAVVKVEK
ncbi:MAG: hypothetical protein WCE75_07180 [Terracidiphilus sp.]